MVIFTAPDMDPWELMSFRTVNEASSELSREGPKNREKEVLSGMIPIKRAESAALRFCVHVRSN